MLQYMTKKALGGLSVARLARSALPSASVCSPKAKFFSTHNDLPVNDIYSACTMSTKEGIVAFKLISPVVLARVSRLTNRKYYVMAERGQLQLEYRQRSPFNNNNNYAGSYERAAAAILRLSPEQIGEILALGDPMFPQHTSCLITRKEFKINNGGFNGLAGDTEAPVTKTLSVYLSFERTFIFEMSFAATAESPEISGKLHCTVGQTKVLRELMTAAIPVLHCWQTLPTLKLEDRQAFQGNQGAPQYQQQPVQYEQQPIQYQKQPVQYQQHQPGKPLIDQQIYD